MKKKQTRNWDEETFKLIISLHYSGFFSVQEAQFSVKKRKCYNTNTWAIKKIIGDFFGQNSVCDAGF